MPELVWTPPFICLRRKDYAFAVVIGFPEERLIFH